MTWSDIVDVKVVSEALNKVYREGEPFCPKPENIFRAFSILPPDKVRVVLVGQDPYPQKGIATGILFANKENTPEDKLSPSLKVIKNSFLRLLQNPEKGINFDPSLVHIAEQGVLMINSALTVEMNKPGSHSMIWRPFVSTLLRNLSNINHNIIFVLFGSQARTFRPYINKENFCVELVHPAYYARTGGKEQEEGESIYGGLWRSINALLISMREKEISWI